MEIGVIIKCHLSCEIVDYHTETVDYHKEIVDYVTKVVNYSMKIVKIFSQKFINVEFKKIKIIGIQTPNHAFWIQNHN